MSTLIEHHKPIAHFTLNSPSYQGAKKMKPTKLYQNF